MYNHHKKAIEDITNKLKTNEEILGIIIGGSVAHGFANEKSDIDIMIVLSDEDFQKHLKEKNIGYYEEEICPRDGGYVDGKYISLDFIKKVCTQGSEPAKFAFKDAFVTYSKVEGLKELVENASSYPIKNKEINLERFISQFKGWHWYYNEGLKRNNLYLINIAATNMVLFAGRLILTYNETLYPYHKWFFKVLEQCPNKPENLINLMNNLIEDKNETNANILYDSIINFTDWNDGNKPWNIQFMLDSELTWLDGFVPVADI
ncbi:nucleotidyltransferase domain-containing protein [Clostridium sp.]|uniref:nucleotidyltransferase domain-containing protein n=1 Tax=Clostridium sp. TaxID=1506 RepID=UPI002845095A|nr:nucleotidyltransferase domain-containing protein [Clostridium sp.]MDR3595974.1 nucleotidyltransferase domain-containing protein [Clostridium sp.]